MSSIQKASSEIQTVPSQPLQPVAANEAVTISGSFDVVRPILSGCREPQRPNRNRPLSSEETEDIEANIEARQSGEPKPIGELWKDLGL